MSSRLAAVAGFFCPAAAAGAGCRTTAASATARSKATARPAISDGFLSLLSLLTCSVVRLRQQADSKVEAVQPGVGSPARAYVAGEFCAVRSYTSCDRRVGDAFGESGPMGGGQVGCATWFVRGLRSAVWRTHLKLAGTLAFARLFWSRMLKLQILSWTGSI